ncbi:MAG: hypothetical protein IPG17_30715 [Sandaracinaceae bacterium]|nr:hypothetical protein [Sandaracinaceae bacterium]
MDAIERLADLSVRSAQDVVRAGRARFISRYVGSDASRQAAAEAIFAKARSQSAAAAAFYVAAHPALGQANLGFVPNLDVSDITPDIPEYDTIFTAPTGTRCAWCQSVHGPSAYLVDLLGWMEQRARPDALSAGPETALDALLARRPDLGDLPLTCENVERVLPMIDLTIEILEAKVSEDTEESSVYSSEADTEEQLAGPQHINDAVYGPTLPEDLGESLPERPRLGDGLKSFLTPFHRPLIEARAFLGELGVARVALMEAFVASTELSDAELAIEHIGLSIEGAAAITGTEDEADYWSLTIGDPVTLGQLRRAADLTTVQVF